MGKPLKQFGEYLKCADVQNASAKQKSPDQPRNVAADDLDGSQEIEHDGEYRDDASESVRGKITPRGEGKVNI
jgi:hypothetical protein